MKLLKDALNKAQDLVTDPKVVAVGKLANGLLDVAAKIGQAHLGGPLAVAGAVPAILDTLNNHLSFEDQCDRFVSHNNLQEEASQLPSMMHRVGAFSRLPLEVVAKTDNGRIEGMQDSQGKWLAFYYSAEDVEDVYYITPGFDMALVRDAIWTAIGKPILKLSTDKEQEQTTVIGYSYDSTPYIGEHDPAAFAAKWEKYLDRGISRGILLHGPPGSGKTSFIRAVARHLNKRLLISPPHFLGHGSTDSIEQFVRALQPDILLLDDIDWASAGLEYAMTLTDDMRRVYPKMLVASTCNYLKRTNAALLRPGRLGERVEFKAPPEKDKEEVLRLYMGLYGVDTKQFDLRALLVRMTHQEFTHDYVRFVAEQAVFLEQKELEAYVVDMNQHLAWVSDMWPDNNEVLTSSSGNRQARKRASSGDAVRSKKPRKS